MSANKLPRCKCHVCGAEVAIRKHGELREHQDHRDPLYGVGRGAHVPICPGSGCTTPFSRLAAVRLRR